MILHVPACRCGNHATLVVWRFQNSVKISPSYFFSNKAHFSKNILHITIANIKK